MSDRPHPQAALLAVMEQAARAGAEVALRHYHRTEVTGLAAKAPRDWVTAADLEVEAVISARLAAAYPEAAIAGEEGTGTRPGQGAGGLSFLIDPIDGTTNFAFRIPCWTVVICALDGAEPIAGVVLDPLRDEMFSALRGGGGWLNGRPLPRLRPVPPEQAIIGIGTPPGGQPRSMAPRAWRDLLWQVAETAGDLRKLGSAALACAYVACGRHHAMFEDALDRLDYLAAALLLEELGGRVTDFDGTRQTGDGPVLALAPGQDWLADRLTAARRIARA